MPFRVQALGQTVPLLPRGGGGAFSGPVTICTWNSQGLFGVRIPRTRRKLDQLHRLALASDVVLVQECHCGRSYEDWFDQQLEDSHVSRWCSLSDSPAGGVGFIFKKSFLEQFTTLMVQVLLPGRLAVARLCGPRGFLDIFNVHLNHENPQRRRQDLQTIAGAVAPPEEVHSILAGDWNFVTSANDRCTPDGLTTAAEADPEAADWDRLFPAFSELFQLEPTLRGTMGRGWARLDRIYSSRSMAILLAQEASATALCCDDGSSPLSDHRPVHAKLMTGSAARSSLFPSPIPAWIPASEKLTRYVDEEAATANVLGKLDCFNGLMCIKVAFQKAATRIRREARHDVSDLPEARLGPCIGLLNSLLAHDMYQVTRILNQYAFLRDSMKLEANWDTQLEYLLAVLQKQTEHLIAELNDKPLRCNIADELLSPSSGTPDLAQEKRNKINVMVGILSAWRARRTAPRISAVTRPDGSVTSDKAQMSEVLGNHWGGVFNQAEVQEEEVHKFVSQFSTKFPEVDWNLTEDEFDEMLRHTGNSAPGPDGIPYACWRCAPQWMRSALYTCWLQWLSGRPLPSDFTHSFLSLIPQNRHACSNGSRYTSSVPRQH